MVTGWKIENKFIAQASGLQTVGRVPLGVGSAKAL